MIKHTSLEEQTQKFKTLKLDESSVKLPMLEMHTSGFFDGGKMLLILGGRGFFTG
jgi:hypothetical protein